MHESRRVLRLELEGRWSAEELGGALVSLSDLYDLRLFLELLHEDLMEWQRYFPELQGLPSIRWRRLSRRPHWTWFPWWPGPPTLDEAHLSRLPEVIEPEERLKVRRIEYGSPGVTDLIGIGEVVGHVKDFTLKLIERRDSRRSRELSDERAALENDRLRIENARNFVALGRDLGYSQTELRELAHYVDGKQEPLARLIEGGKLLDVSSPEQD